MLEKLKEEVLEANLELVRQKLVHFTFGNVSGIDRKNGLVVIKPSGVDYDAMRVSDMVVVDLDGNIAEGQLRPSSDTPTHIALYREFPTIGGVTHTHSTYATAWAQAGRGIPAMGTTHADYFFGEIPCTRPLREEEILQDYEWNTGLVIVERFAGIDPQNVAAVLVHSHGPFTWGKDAMDSVHHAAVLETIGQNAMLTQSINIHAGVMQQRLLEKHFFRKHGPGAYYGQENAAENSEP